MRNSISLMTIVAAATVVVGAQQVEFSKNFIDVRTAAWKGVVLAPSCFQKLGLAEAIADASCSRDAVAQGRPLGILTDDDGFMTFVGETAENNFSELIQYVGKRVEVTGTSAQPTGNYIPRQLDATTIALEEN